MSTPTPSSGSGSGKGEHEGVDLKSLFAEFLNEAPTPDLKAPEEALDRLKGAYFEQLNEHQPFVQALEALFAKLEQLLQHLPLHIDRPTERRGKFATLEQLPQDLLPWVWTGELAIAVPGHARAHRREAKEAGERVQALGQRLKHLRALLAASGTGTAPASPWTRPAMDYALWEGHAWLWEAWRRLGDAWRTTHQAAARQLVVDFCQRWPLPTKPTGAETDVWHSFRLWRLGHSAKRRAKLIPGPWAVEVPAPGAAAVEAELEGVRIVTPTPTIHPNCPLPFRWDPARESREALDERVEDLLADIKKSIYAQAAALEAQVEAAGWRKPPHRTPDLALRAERLFRRAVLKQSWEQIKRYTGARDRAMVRRQVLYDAELIGVPLPQVLHDAE